MNSPFIYDHTEVRDPPCPMVVVFRDEETGKLSREPILQIGYTFKYCENGNGDFSTYCEMHYFLKYEYAEKNADMDLDDNKVGIEYNGIEETWDDWRCLICNCDLSTDNNTLDGGLGEFCDDCWVKEMRRSGLNR